MSKTKTVVIAAAALLLAGCNPQPMQGRGKPPKAELQPQVVTLVPTGSGASTTWQVQFPGKQPETPKTATSKVAAGAGPTKFIINVAGNASNYPFRATNPLSVWAGPKEPAQTGIDTQIIGPFLEQGKLVFWDLNYGPAVKLSYSVHFEGDIPSVDPIIDNGGNNNW